MSDKKLLKFLNGILLITLLSFCYEFVMAEKNENTFSKNDNVVVSRQKSSNKFNYSDVIQKIREEEGAVDNSTKSSQNLFLSQGGNFFSAKGIPVSSFIPIADEAFQNSQSAKDDTERKYLLRKALFFCDEYLKIYPNDEKALLKAGKYCCLLNRREKAKQYLMKAYALYPQNPRVHKAMGDFFYAFSDYNMALEYYKLALSSGFLENYETNIDTAKCYSKLGDTQNAVRYFEIALYLNPNSEEASKRMKELLDGKTLPDPGKSSDNSDDEINSTIEETFQIKN